VTFDFEATDDNVTPSDLDFTGAGVAVCNDALTCAQGQGTFVADVSNLVDPNGVLPAGYVYTFDGTVFVDPGPFDAAGVFGLNAFAPASVPTGVPVGALPANIAVDPDVSVFVDIVTGGGLAFTPPIDVCVHYDDADMDGVVDGTSVAVDTLVLLHAQAIGDAFQDVTTSAGGGGVCGQVGSLSPVVLAVGPPPTTTTTLPTLSCETAVECLDAAVLLEICPGEEIPKKMPKIYTKKLTKARKLLEKIGRASKVKNGERLLAKGRKNVEKNVEKIGVKAGKLAEKRPRRRPSLRAGPRGGACPPARAPASGSQRSLARRPPRR
jgi:hypothetical protein